MMKERAFAWRMAVVGLIVFASSSGASNAQDLFSFSYDNLTTSYSSSSSLFSVQADLSTSGRVARVVDTLGTAEFDVGQAAGSFLADFTVIPLAADLYMGMGSFTITDVDGDAISGTVQGTWSQFGQYADFYGGMSDIHLNDAAGDGWFEGTTSGLFDMELPGEEPYTGTMTGLVLTGGNWFDADFDQPMNLLAQVVPEPTTALLLLAGAVTILRRR